VVAVAVSGTEKRTGGIVRAAVDTLSDGVYVVGCGVQVVVEVVALG
jgi:hypothetical protein